MSSGAIHLTVPWGPGAEVSVQLKLAIDEQPKSPKRAVPVASIRMLSWQKKTDVEGMNTSYPLGKR